MVIASNFQYIHQLSRSAYVPITTALNTGFYLTANLLNTPRTLLICGSSCLMMHATVWTEMFLCHSIKISISLECLNQSSQFFHHCKGKSMTYLEMDIIFSRFFLFLKYNPHSVIAVLFTHPVYVFLWHLWSSEHTCFTEDIHSCCVSMFTLYMYVLCVSLFAWLYQPIPTHNKKF